MFVLLSFWLNYVVGIFRFGEGFLCKIYRMGCGDGRLRDWYSILCSKVSLG